MIMLHIYIYMGRTLMTSVGIPPAHGLCMLNIIIRKTVPGYIQLKGMISTITQAI